MRISSGSVRSTTVSCSRSTRRSAIGWRSSWRWRFHFTPSPGTYFQLVDYRDISDEPDHLLARRLTESIGVATIPVSVLRGSAEGSAPAAPLLLQG